MKRSNVKPIRRLGDVFESFFTLSQATFSLSPAHTLKIFFIRLKGLLSRNLFLLHRTTFMGCYGESLHGKLPDRGPLRDFYDHYLLHLALMLEFPAHH